MHSIRMGALVLILLALSPVFAADGSALATAMDVPAGDVVSASANGELIAYEAISNLGVIGANEGAGMTLLFTGSIGHDGSGNPVLAPQSGTDIGAYGVTGDLTELALELTVPDDANSLKFDFYFMSAEYEEFVGSSYNDSFTAQVTGSAWSGNAAVDGSGNPVSINSVLFTVTDPASLDGTGFGALDNYYEPDYTAGGGTGWLTVVVPADPGDTLLLELTVQDVSDGIYDSAVLLDNFEWSDDDLDFPVLVEEVLISYLSPKRGSIEGGEISRIVGDKFNEDCQAFFDNEPVNTVYENRQSLRVTTVPHAEGLVDVRVECEGLEPVTLHNGYTYYDVGADDPFGPEITTLEPHYVSVDGGQTVRVVGAEFVEGTTVTVAGEEVTTTFLTESTLEIVVPPHAAGLVDLVVSNPDGLEASRTGALLYIENPGDDADGGDTDDDLYVKGLNQSGGCSHVEFSWTAMSMVLAMFAARRRS